MLFNHSRLCKPSLVFVRTFFRHRKYMISNFRRNISLVGQQLGQNSYQIWNLRTLKYREALKLCPPTIFSSPKIGKKQDPCNFSYTPRNSWNECLRIFFCVILDVEFDSDTPEIISLLFRIDFMKFDYFDIMCPALTEKCSSRSSRIVTPLCEQHDIMKFFANRCWYSTLHCFIMMKIEKTWHGRTDFHEKWRFFEGPQTSDKHSKNIIQSFSPMETLVEACTNFFNT